jgi:hypothetical protein
MKQNQASRLVLAAAALTAGLSLTACRDDDVSSLTTVPSPSASIITSSTSPSPVVLTSEQKKQQETLKVRFKQHAVELLRLIPSEGTAPAAIHVKDLKAPGLESEGEYLDLYRYAFHTLGKKPLIIRDDAANITIESDSADPSSFQLAKINGQNDFYQKESIKRYRYIPPVKSPEPNALLRAIIRGGWRPEAVSASLGKSDSYYNNYDIFFKQNVEVEQRQAVFSLVFRKGYGKPVIGSIGNDSKREEIEAALGKPHYENGSQDPVFGYKLEPFYIFFSGAAAPYDIAVYQRDNSTGPSGAEGTSGASGASDTASTGLPTLTALLNNLKLAGKETENIIDTLKEAWTDYNRFDNARGGHSIYYNSKGLRADYSIVDMNGGKALIEIYGNYEGPLTDAMRLPEGSTGLLSLTELPTLPDALSSFRFRLHEDMIFNQEKNRLSGERNIAERAAAAGIPSPDGTRIVLVNDNTTYDSVSFYILHTRGDRPNQQIHVGSFSKSFTWLSDRYFVFENSFKGIVGYDTLLDKNIDIKVDTELPFEYVLDEVKDGKIYYTNSTGKHEISYSFDAKGNLVLK